MEHVDIMFKREVKTHMAAGHDVGVMWRESCGSDVQPDGKVNMTPLWREDDGGDPEVYCRDCGADLDWNNEFMEWA